MRIEEAKIQLWCDRVDRSHHEWRAQPSNSRHCVEATADDFPEERELPCPCRGCDGTVMTRPQEAKKKKKARKRRAKKKADDEDDTEPSPE